MNEVSIAHEKPVSLSKGQKVEKFVEPSKEFDEADTAYACHHLPFPVPFNT